MTKKQGLFILMICISAIFLIASVSASDLNETDVINIDDEDGENNDYLSISEETNVLCTNHTPSDFYEIESAIASASDGDSIILSGNYVFSNTVSVGKQLTFVGINDATLD